MRFAEICVIEDLRTDKPFHVFEAAGLGKAPFRLVQVYFSGGLRACDFCSTGIKEICVIGDARGKTFIVGNVCVNKTGDRGLIDPVKQELNRLRAERRNQQADERIEAAKVKLQDIELRAKLAEQPHPYEYHREKGGTLLTYVEWLFQNAGRSGRLRAAKTVEEICS